jgi:hypothetical protein
MGGEEGKGWWLGGEVAQRMFTHMNKCKNNKINIFRKKVPLQKKLFPLY